MKDSFGRTIDYMRISITDRCNLRCRYCIPEGVECVPRWKILSLEEIKAIAICAAGLGIRYIKVTGGEPLVRRDCCRLIEGLKAIPGIERVTITTNGVLLERYLYELVRAGIDGINISLDTLDREMYRDITGSDNLDRVLDVIKKASVLPVSVKINAVSLDFEQMAAGRSRPYGRDGWQQLAELAGEYPVDVRFIEMMPIGYGKNFKTINHQELLEELRRCYPKMDKDNRTHGPGPAVYYQIPGFMGSIGLISAVHGSFCGSCNRIRLTSQGYLKACLCYEDGVDLRSILRDGQESQFQEGHYPLKSRLEDGRLQEKLRAAMSQVILDKPGAHCFEHLEQITEENNMISIGG